MPGNPILLIYMTESCSSLPFATNPQRGTVYKAITSGVHYFARSVVISPYDQSGQLVGGCSRPLHQPTRAVTSALGALLICQCNFQYLLDFHKEIVKPFGAVARTASNRRLPLIIKGKLYQLTQTALLKQ